LERFAGFATRIGGFRTHRCPRTAPRSQCPWRLLAVAAVIVTGLADQATAAPLAPRPPERIAGHVQPVQFFWPFDTPQRRGRSSGTWSQPVGRSGAGDGGADRAVPSEPAEPAGPLASQFTRTPAIEDATRVVVFGDSMAVGLADGLAGVMTEGDGYQVQRMTRTNSGIVRKDYYDWAAEVRAAIEGQHIDIAIWMIGINDRQAIRDQGESHEPKTPRWTELYQQRVDELIKLVQDHGAAVYWVELPIMRAQRYSQDIAYINNAVRERVGLSGAQFIDTWDAFADADGAYSSSGPDLNGERRTMRRSDGIHLTNAGNAKLAHFVNQVLGRDISVAGVDGRRVIRQARSGGLVVAPGAGSGEAGDELAGAVEGEPDGTGGVGGSAVALSALGANPKGDGEATVSPYFQVLMRGDALEPKPGRADDFAWPRPR